MQKEIFVMLIALIGFGFCANAQSNGQKTTQAVPISNGCGSEQSSTAGKVVTKVGQATDAAIGGSWSNQTKSCDQHDKDYYNGVPKKTADDNFQQRSSVMGTAVKAATETSTKSYNEAQKDRETNQKYQSTWEKENKQCLDNSSYRVEPKK